MHVGKEPNYHTACEWWSDVRDYATPVGWKNHMFRFNVLFNGTLLADLAPRLIYAPWKRFAAWEGQGVQINFPYLDAFHWWEHFGRGDNRMTRQSWTDNPTPVLRSEWPRYGLLIRQEIFGFIPGAGDVQTGLEPLFAWIRFSVADRVEALRPGVPPYNRHPLCVAISRPHVIPTMECRLNLLHRQEESLYPRALTPSTRYGARSLRASHVITEKNATDGQYTLLTGSFGYPMVWSVQAALTMIFALDPWGRHEDVARALELYRTYQGQVAPPSPHLKAHRRSA